ncbi:TfoX/Sxy family protein [Lentzea sp. NBRC 102530]|uniref:TfoX/Sxy family protein n=1 Tax=Lentzea sp. NBRC 102530 TaxID=3032201 RepID=UPI0024A19E88|nr:TfoX/Sxy family protein [Lentzea sp. NBRC 102530]GLY53224.1 RNA methyltransferase [Lentzea sp. NBRC 102530]
MAYDEGLAHRLGESLGDLPDLSTRKMFGTLVFLWRGNMLVGALGSDLLARVGPEAQEEALGLPGTRVFDFTGKPMRGWVVVDGEAISEDEALDSWLARCRDFVEALPPK